MVCWLSPACPVITVTGKDRRQTSQTYLSLSQKTQRPKPKALQRAIYHFLFRWRKLKGSDVLGSCGHFAIGEFIISLCRKKTASKLHLHVKDECPHMQPERQRSQKKQSTGNRDSSVLCLTNSYFFLPLGQSDFGDILLNALRETLMEGALCLCKLIA